MQNQITISEIDALAESVAKCWPETPLPVRAELMVFGHRLACMRGKLLEESLVRTYRKQTYKPKQPNKGE